MRAFVALVVILTAPPLHAQKTDIVIMRNGDRITGEIKGLQRGKMQYSTDDMGTVYIEWEKIRRVISNKFFEVEDTYGARYYGAIDQGSDSGQVVVRLGPDSLPVLSDTLEVSRIVLITRIRNTFWKRVKGYIDVGFNYTKADNKIEWTLKGNATYRGRKFGGDLSGDWFLRNQDSVATTSRASVGLGGQRFLAHRWGVGTGIQAQHNSELNLDLRTFISLGALRNLIRTNSMELGTQAALVGSREQFNNVDSAVVSLELLLGGDYQAFRFDSPKLDFTTGLDLFPSLTLLGRLRMEFELRLSYELISDFTVGVSLFDSFDSGPPGTDDTRNDFGINITVGWTFN